MCGIDGMLQVVCDKDENKRYKYDINEMLKIFLCVKELTRSQIPQFVWDCWNASRVGCDIDENKQYPYMLYTCVVSKNSLRDRYPAMMGWMLEGMGRSRTMMRFRSVTIALYCAWLTMRRWGGR
jgi:hypothetical protein